MSTGAQQLTKEDLANRLDALRTRIEKLEQENEYLTNRLESAEIERDELRERVTEVENDTDLLRIVEDSDNVSAEQRRQIILQHMWRAVRDKPKEERLYGMDTEKVTEILHHPDVDRTTILRWMRTTPRLVGNKDVCWYDGGDSGPGGKPARIHLDLRNAGESLLENVKRQTRQHNGGS